MENNAVKMIAPEIPLSTVHDALTAGKLRSKKQASAENWTFRCHPTKKAILNGILLSQGTNANSFFQGVVDVFLSDYMGEKAFANIALGD